MTDYISREAAIALCDTALEKNPMSCAKGIVVMRDLLIYHAPAVDVAPVVHAHWDDVEVIECEAAQLMVASMRCSACNRYHNEVYHCGNPTEMAHYCGFCGAKMDVKMPKGCKTIPLRRRKMDESEEEDNA